jgi:hypothetical protein
MTPSKELTFSKGGKWYICHYKGINGNNEAYFTDFNGLNTDLIPADEPSLDRWCKYKCDPFELPVYVRTWQHHDLDKPVWLVGVAIQSDRAVLLLVGTYASVAQAEAERLRGGRGSLLHTFFRRDLAGEVRHTDAPLGCFTGDKY